MRAVIISDTHGALQRSELALRQLEPFDLLIHTGDHWTDGRWLANLFSVPLKAVAGNCDGSDHPPRLSFEWSGLRFYLSHGHLQGVRQSINPLVAEAQQHHANLVIYGHTHCSHMESVGSLTVFNPGSVGEPRGSLVLPYYDQPTIGAIDIEDRAVLKLISIYDGQILKETVVYNQDRIDP